VRLRSEIVDPSGAPSGVVQAGGALRSHAANLGIISFRAEMSTRTIGTAVTDCRDCAEWTVTLLLPGSPGAKTEDQEDTKLVVVETNQRVAFQTVCSLQNLFGDERSGRASGHYESKPLEVFGTTS